jgi:hypothetical protein
VNVGLNQWQAESTMQTVISYLGIVRRLGRKFGPYLMVEMLLPGGTLLALLLFLYQRGKLDVRRDARRAVLAAMRTLAGLFEQRVLVPVPAKSTMSKTRLADRL